MSPQHQLRFCPSFYDEMEAAIPCLDYLERAKPEFGALAA
jgi:hypothetical protein